MTYNTQTIENIASHVYDAIIKQREQSAMKRIIEKLIEKYPTPDLVKYSGNESLIYAFENERKERVAEELFRQLKGLNPDDHYRYVIENAQRHFGIDESILEEPQP